MKSAIALFGLMTMTATSALAGDRLVAGEYEITSVIDGKPTTSRYCATPEMAKGTNGDEASDREYVQNAAKTCKIETFTVAGNTIDYSMNCSGVTTKIHAVYHGDHFEGEMTRERDGKTFITHTTAKRVGECTADK